MQTKLLANGDNLRLPSKHTVGMLLESFSSFQDWRSDADADLDLNSLSSALADPSCTQQDRVDLLFRRGRRNAYHKNYDDAFTDFRKAYELSSAEGVNKEDMTFYPDLLDWVGICRHLSYDLTGSIVAYEMCIEALPAEAVKKSAELHVKCAGVKMDEGELEVAETWFDKALEIDPDFPGESHGADYVQAAENKKMGAYFYIYFFSSFFFFFAIFPFPSFF